MEIIKYGDKTQVCSRCGCEFRFNKDDVHKEVKTISVDEGVILPLYITKYYNSEFVRCPQCNKKIEVDRCFY